MEDNRPVILKATGIGKKYIIRHKKKYPIDGTRRDKMKYRLSPQIKEDFWALKDINFEVREGERVAIIGRNGAGKSTLLKLISRITEPTEGRITYYGKVAAMLEVGTGFNIELTGRENVYLNGAILGLSREEIDARFDDIVEFSEVGRFIDTPVKRYSSGMLVRLAFSVASTLDPDILIIDEVLSVGDMRFREKCLKRMGEIANKGKTILCVSHIMNVVRGLCDRAIVLEDGKMIYDGDVEEAIKIYNGIHKEAKHGHYDYDIWNRPQGYYCDRLVIKSLDLLETEDCIYAWNEPIKFKFHVEALREESNVSLRVTFRRDGGGPVSTVFFEPFIDFKEGSSADIYVTVNSHNLAPGDYKAALTLSKGAPYDLHDNIDSIDPDGFLFTVMNVGSENEINGMRDDSARLWSESWGHSRIVDASVEAVIK
ncbi:MAG: ABC transporter ATP-binding protein [Clostridiales bacterium]|nr:ABC transporter ATP-binding protein [Clostridiales bacterium]